ncbi:MAG: hypothetical protein ACREQT_04125 [Candidatus Binataceae bacterium]
MAAFPEPAWFLALGRLMEAEGEVFRRLGYAEVRFAIRILSDDGELTEQTTGLEFNGYALVRAEVLDDTATFDPDFILCGRREIWERMLAEIRQNGRPALRHTLSSLALMGEELWLESNDQLREDKFYRVNQTLQEFFNLAAQLAP